MGDLLLALAFGIVVVALLAAASPLGDLLTPQIYNDLGSLLLAFLMLWAYLAYFQYLLIWAGNLSDEIPWYVRRVEGGWLWVAVGLAGLGFGVPFGCLLFRPLKRNRRALARIAALVIVMQLVNAYWLVEPPFEPGGPAFDWLPARCADRPGWLVAGGLCLAARRAAAAAGERPAPASGSGGCP